MNYGSICLGFSVWKRNFMNIGSRSAIAFAISKLPSSSGYPPTEKLIKAFLFLALVYQKFFEFYLSRLSPNILSAVSISLSPRPQIFRTKILSLPIFLANLIPWATAKAGSNAISIPSVLHIN